MRGNVLQREYKMIFSPPPTRQPDCSPSLSEKTAPVQVESPKCVFGDPEHCIIHHHLLHPCSFRVALPLSFLSLLFPYPPPPPPLPLPSRSLLLLDPRGLLPPLLLTLAFFPRSISFKFCAGSYFPPSPHSLVCPSPTHPASQAAQPASQALPLPPYFSPFPKVACFPRFLLLLPARLFGALAGNIVVYLLSSPAPAARLVRGSR